MPLPAKRSDGEIRARFTLEAGERVYFAVQRSHLGEPLPRAYTQHEIAAQK